MAVHLFPFYHCSALKSWLGPAFCLDCDQEKVGIGRALYNSFKSLLCGELAKIIIYQTLYILSCN